MKTDFADVIEALEGEAPATALAVLVPAAPDMTFSAPVIFAPGGSADILARIESHVKATLAGADVSTPEGREVIRALAYKVARSKTTLDDMGKALVETAKKTVAAVDRERKLIRDRLDELKEEARKPLTEFEEREQRRVAQHELELGGLEEYAEFGPEQPSAAAIAKRLEAFSKRPARQWEEFIGRSSEVADRVGRRLEEMHAEAIKREAEATELARLRAEQAEVAQRERDERIAREAAEKAKRDAEKAAADERFRADALAAAKVREADARAAAAEQAAADAIKAEQHRVACAKLAEDAATAKREANKRHRAKINAAARDAILAAILKTPRDSEEADAQAVVEAIARGEIPHVTISY